MKKVLTFLAAALLLTPAIAWTAPNIEINLTAEVEVIEVVNGMEVTRRIPATEAEPGQIIFYTLTYKNSGDQAATDVKLKDPIPKETKYITGSAFGDGARITFSADGGKTFQEQTLVSFKIKNTDGSISEKHASPDQYTDICWTVGNIPAGFSSTVGFNAMIR